MTSKHRITCIQALLLLHHITSGTSFQQASIALNRSYPVRHHRERQQEIVLPRLSTSTVTLGSSKDGDGDAVKKRKSINALDASLRQVLNESRKDSRKESFTVLFLLLDVNNIRGADDFRWTNSNFLERVLDWNRSNDYSDTTSTSIHPVLIFDHGRRLQAFASDTVSDTISQQAGAMTILFAGPYQTADDLMVYTSHCLLNAGKQSISGDDAVDMRRESRPKIIVAVVTTDGELKLRCRQQGVYKVYPSVQMVGLLKEWKRFQLDQEFAQDISSSKKQTEMGEIFVEHELELLEKDIREYEQSTVKTQDTSYADDETTSPSLPGSWKSGLFSYLDKQIGAEKDDQIEAGENKESSFGEKSWHRVVIAEQLRQLLSSRSAQIHTGDDTNNNQFNAISDYCNHINGMDTKTTKSADDEDTIPTINFDGPVESLCLDHRLDTDSQKMMVQYFVRSMSSAGIFDESTLDDDDNFTKPVPTRTERAEELLRQYVTESPYKTQDQILSRYCNETPSHLQFTRYHDLRALLLDRVAVREKRSGDKKRMWYLLSNKDDASDPSSVPTAQGKQSEDQLEQALSSTLDCGGKVQVSEAFSSRRWRRSSSKQKDALNSESMNVATRIERLWFDSLAEI